MPNTDPVAGKEPRPLSMNDTLPSGNPSLRSVLIFLGCATLLALAIIYRSSFGL
jgi:hypothetical protein